MIRCKSISVVKGNKKPGAADCPLAGFLALIIDVH
jgi:hypothetical protein